jgi:hypothetical protein
MSLQALIEGYQPGNVPRVQRSGAAYEQTYQYFYGNVQLLIDRYRELEQHDQTARLIRDDIEHALRRYHEYCIQQNTGAHYLQEGLGRDQEVDFEHVIPARIVRDALISGRMTIDQAFNAPTCNLSREKHKVLDEQKLTKTTPCPFWFWRRYQNLGIKIKTRSGEVIDTETWNLDTHYEHFSS